MTTTNTKMKKYYIYHIEGKKIGCSDNPKRRIKKQGYANDEYTILETYDDIYLASNRELELQRQWGYKVDTKPYWKTIKMATKESRSKGGKIQGVKIVASGQLAAIQEARQRIIEQKDINGNLIAEYKSGVEAATLLQLHASSITNVCKGKYKTAGGYTFNYK